VGLSFPAPKLGGTGGVKNDPGEVVRTGLGIGANLVRTESGATPVTQLCQRDRILSTSGKVADTHIDSIAWVRGLAALKLFLEEGKQVSRMKAVSNLRATAIEADIF
jgi:hypothetical protein